MVKMPIFQEFFGHISWAFWSLFHYMYLGRSGECKTAAVSDWSNSQCRGRNSWPWSRGYLHTRSCRLHQYGSQKPDKPLPVSTQVFHEFHLQIFLVLIPGCFRANIEVKEWGRHGINASNQKQKVGILKQKYFEVWSKIKLDVGIHVLLQTTTAKRHEMSCSGPSQPVQSHNDKFRPC